MPIRAFSYLRKDAKGIKIVCFEHEGKLFATPKQYAERFLRELGYKVKYASRRYEEFDFIAEKKVDAGSGFEDEDVIFVTVVVISRFYINQVGGIGLQAGYTPLTFRQKELGVRKLFVTKCGKCSFSRKELVEMMREDILKVVSKKK